MSPTRPRIRLPIQTERLVLRPMMQDDAPAMHEVYGDTDVMRFLRPDVPRTLEETRRWVQAKIDLFERDDGMSLWSVVERTSGNVIGDCGLQWEEPRAGEPAELALGGRGGRASWGNGYGTEAAVACLIAVFRELEVDRIVGMTHADNRPARRVMERLNMAYEGPCWDDGTGVLYAAERSTWTPPGRT